MDKSPDAFRSIGEVSRLVGVAPHVLRYWETQFSQLSPVKRGDGRRYYRPDDLRLVAGLCQVMREEGLSIRGAKRLIATDRGAGLRRLGAARLGEMEQAMDLPADTPADAAVPAHSPTDDPQPIDVSRASAARRPVPVDGLPLFAENPPTVTRDWLSRLVATATLLREFRAAQMPLPPQVGALRDALQAARGD